ncbi:tripartite tricarboxylate transporter permease [Roseovarius mucosus]|uniref:tripartite tricarboxylate transporter permease n=1 Tax=Roseovarius mucosus TaxID=215743 RepID=UPI003F71A36D
MDILANLGLGLSVALSGTNLLYCFVGVVLGTFLGVIPGVGVLAAISMLFPLTYFLEPTTALIMLAGIWYGTSYGGSTASILLNVPGTPANAVTCLDGYPMAQKGRAAMALFMTTVASFVGGSIGIVLLSAFAPLIAGAALAFGSAEYFALMVLGLIAATGIVGDDPLKGLIMVVVGLLLGLVGTDVFSGTARFTLGYLELRDGIALVALAMGLFGVSEVIASVGRIRPGRFDASTIRIRAMVPTRDEMRRSWMPMLRGSGVGAFFGALPGTGPSLAAFIAYAVEKRAAREPERFGKGAIEGVMAPESANNSADQTSFIPTLALGIPGSPTMALMLGVLIIHGIAPGPGLMTNEPALFWGLIMSFWIGNILLVLLNVPLIGLWVRLLTIPYPLLFPAVLMFICIGTYSVNNSAFDVMVVMVFGALGYLFRLLSFPPAPLLLGFVLGPLLEEHFRRAMLLSRGDPMTFVERPISSVLLGIAALILIWTLFNAIRRTRPQQTL